MSETRALGLLFGIHALFLFYGISQLSIGYHEAVVFFQGQGVLHYLMRASCALFGQNDWALRLPFVVIHFTSALLLYKISKPLLKRKFDRLFSVLIYLMLPGVSAAALLANEASLTILLTLLFIWFHQNSQRALSLIVLCFSLAVDNSFAIFYFALFFYGIATKDRLLFVLALVLFGLSMSLYGFDTGGKPKGHFLDTFGVYAAAFSPLLFLYYMYAIYRIAIKEKKEILWYITFVAFAFSFLLSLRQRLMLEDFIPFAVIAIPLVVRVFFNSFRVRLPRHRRWHASLAMIILFSLSINFVMTIFNKPMYHLVKETDKHFVYNYHVAKELAQWLHGEGIHAVDTNDEKLQLRLQFYGIKQSNTVLLQEISDAQEATKNDFLLSYAGRNVVHYRIFSEKYDKVSP